MDNSIEPQHENNMNQSSLSTSDFRLSTYDYGQFIVDFPEFASTDSNTQARINNLIADASQEIEFLQWGSLTTQAIKYRVACFLAKKKIRDSCITRLSSDKKQIKRFSVDQEYTVEYDTSVIDSKNDLVIDSLNFYCQEYERLLSLSALGILYSNQ